MHHPEQTSIHSTWQSPALDAMQDLTCSLPAKYRSERPWCQPVKPETPSKPICIGFVPEILPVIQLSKLLKCQCFGAGVCHVDAADGHGCRRARPHTGHSCFVARTNNASK